MDEARKFEVSKSHRYWLALLALLVFALWMAWSILPSRAAPAQQATATATPIATPAGTPQPSTVDYAMYFKSRPQDDGECAMTVEEGEIVIDAAVTNPAISCPDMFAWKLFAEVITQTFWADWAADQYTWPDEPYPMCLADATDTAACCSVSNADNPGYDDPDNPGIHCPFFPGDHLVPGVEPNMLEARPPAIAQGHPFFAPVSDDPGRVIRQEVAELVFRNKPLFEYVFANNLYNTEGLGEVFTNSNTALTNGAPYRQRSEPGALVEIDFPIASIMIKSDWLSEERAAEIGLVDDPENPYIKLEINSPVTDDNGTILQPGLHYLVAMHISSKDLPNWLWATFEHVNNPGRCDVIGCNDSYGYASPDAVAAGQFNNYTVPHTQSDNLVQPSTIFDLGKPYAGGERSAALAAIFEGLGIGTTDQEGNTPSASDRGWLSYRLKGSQTDFTDSTGHATILGNSVTEAGFVNTSSCIGCHVRASVNATGGGGLGVFPAQLSEIGYPESNNGSPDPNWYYFSSTNPSVEALQSDFVWGVLFANSVVTSTTTTTATTSSD